MLIKNISKMNRLNVKLTVERIAHEIVNYLSDEQNKELARYYKANFDENTYENFVICFEEFFGMQFVEKFANHLDNILSKELKK